MDYCDTLHLMNMELDMWMAYDAFVDVPMWYFLSQWAHNDEIQLANM